MTFICQNHQIKVQFHIKLYVFVCNRMRNQHFACVPTTGREIEFVNFG
jgi:hypothetical protein